jgi:hypothetical protein
MPSVLVLPLLNSKQEKVFGKSRPFKIKPECIDTTGTTYRYVGDSILYQQCLLCKTTKHITLSTYFDGAGKNFFLPKKIELPAGSYVYLIPDCHNVHSLDPWTHLDVSVEE